MKVNNYNYGQLNVLINSYGAHDNDENHKKIAEFNKINLFTISKISDYFKDTPFFNYGYMDFEKINHNYTHPKLQKLYELIEKIIIENNVKLFVWLGDPIMLHRSLIEKLKKSCYVSAWTFDDPMTSERVVKPVANLYDCIFHVAPYYDGEKTTKEVFQSWGAIKSELIHNGVNEGKYNKIVDFNNRDIDIVFVGSVFRERLIFLFKLKKYFGSRLQIFGYGWNGENMSFFKKIVLYLLKFYYGVPKIKTLSNEEYLKILERSKIGINDHMENGAGPSSARTFELPLNGVLQFCDIEKGIKIFFEPNEEIITYKYKNIESIIPQIEYYLTNEKKRLEIIQKSFNKAKNNYMIWHSFEKIIKVFNSESK
jgi:spore maturation protein CgeB